MLLKRIWTLILSLMMVGATTSASAKTILFVPQDDRPVSYGQPVEVVAQTGNEILTPPKEILTNPSELWTWLNENAKTADAAVISSDALLYGGLIPSRKHEIPENVLHDYLNNFKTLRKENPNLRLYAFCSLMRTPEFGEEGNIEEPEYYAKYGADIFKYTALIDKRETKGFLTVMEQIKLERLERSIPENVLSDYFARREKNLNATKKLIELAHEGTVDYFVIGRDDNSPLSQTHREDKQLKEYLRRFDNFYVKTHAGIDEYGMLVLARAVNELRGKKPKVNVQFNCGVGENTIPAYSDEKIDYSVRNEIKIAGGTYTSNPKHADFVLYVNSDREGNTYHTHNSFPPQILSPAQENYFRMNAKDFVDAVEEGLNKNLPIGIADITFGNGSDIALMDELKQRDLLFKIHAYGGWNTATNTTGFVLGTGMLTDKMNQLERKKLLVRRYLDDWGYQTYVRTKIAEELSARPDGLNIFVALGEHEQEIMQRETELIREFIRQNFPPINYLDDITVSNPWHRMFECDLHYGAGEH
ncbi:MAG: DUF4127 family protein [Selenomonadaceae bacterium]|nr:DUF4127 family protein [Selenomonadaceae bacterium]